MADPADWPGIEATFENAYVGLPSGYIGLTQPFIGRAGEARKLPGLSNAKPLPTVLLMHGASGVDDERELIKWLIEDAHVAVIAPDSMSLPHRIRYVSPVAKEIYEKVHTLRQAEIKYALAHIRELPYIDSTKLILAGYSEGGVAAARWRGHEFLGRLIYSWSCELNYYVALDAVGVGVDEPVLNVMSTRDPYFGPGNPWNTPYNLKGHCGDAFRFHHAAQILLLPNVGHNVFLAAETRSATVRFVETVLKKN
jgi:dienelactone hydrolase